MADSSLDLREAALAYISAHQVMTLATAGSLGTWAAAVFYANHDFQLIFLSAGHTRHTMNMEENPRVAATIQEDYADWPQIKGIQLEGLVRRLGGGERENAVDRYQRKYPFIQQAGEKMTEALAAVNWYSLIPDLLYYIDNSKGLGHRDKIPL